MYIYIEALILIIILLAVTIPLSVLLLLELGVARKELKVLRSTKIKRSPKAVRGHEQLARSLRRRS